MTDFENSAIHKELELRRGSAKTTYSDSSFLYELNAALEDLEPQASGQSQDYPHIWVVGLPRSGTTLAMQRLVSAFDVGYPNNLMARFWRAPTVGAKLSKLLLKKQTCIDFTSNYGVSTGINGPHEFSYFWNELFGIDDVQNFQPSSIGESLDWVHIRGKLNGIARSFGKTMIYKGLMPAYFVEQLAQEMPKSIFINLKRNCLDVAASILKAREYYYNDRQQWWSMPVDNHQQYLDLPYWKQIAIQLRELDTLYAQPLERVDPKQVVTTTYEEICSAPEDLFTKLSGACDTLGWGQLSKREGEVPKFTPSKPLVDEKSLELLQRGLDEEYPEYYKG